MSKMKMEELNVDSENQTLIAPTLTDTSGKNKAGAGNIMADRSFRLRNEAKSAAELLKKGGKARLSQTNLMYDLHSSSYQNYRETIINKDDLPEYIDTLFNNTNSKGFADLTTDDILNDFFKKVPAIIIG